MEALTRRFPTQDQGESIAEYFADFEQLAVKHGIERLSEAVKLLRVDPEQEFFPKPNEVARKIEYLRLRRLPSHIYAQG
jgi:hypothetical protein